MKANALVARDAARELAIPYMSKTVVDTIVCMENTKVIGAYLAEELLLEGMSVLNAGGDIYIVTPMQNIDGKFTFYESERKWIAGKNILLLTSAITSGRTIGCVLECLEYYGGKIAGISTLFLADTDSRLENINTLFTCDDIPGYKLSEPSECEMCREGIKLDALISSEGYSKIL